MTGTLSDEASPQETVREASSQLSEWSSVREALPASTVPWKISGRTVNDVAGGVAVPTVTFAVRVAPDPLASVTVTFSA
ncbi:hypothetical protein RKD27_004379 [Streptomyces sp. SAI-126]